VHSLGEGRYEVVDKGSSNGVRVNGSDLRRSIVEPGDIIELGDVRFRFVGAGQIFLPGVGESQQLEAIPDRPPTSIRPTAGGGTSLLPFVIVGAIVAIVVVGGFWFMQQRNHEPTGETPKTAPDDAEQIALQAAKKECDDGNCDLAHDRLVAKIDKKSPLRQSADYQTIETRWADSMLAQADKELDVGKKRRMLRDIQSTDTVPQPRRNIAIAKLAELDAATSGTTTAPTNTNVMPSATHTQVVPTTTVTTSTATTTATATATHTARPTGGSVFNQASALATSGDTAGARALLEPRVFGSGHATPDEVNLLKGICKAQHDKSCTAAIGAKYP
jgi:hypothetical protein